MKITKDAIDKFAPSKIFKDNEKRINSIDFSHDGQYLVTSSDDESLNLYDTQSGKKSKTIYAKKYGIDLIRFTHTSSTVITASKNDWDESIRYLSLHDNKYLRYFKGHRGRVISLAMSPKDDTFISSSLDDTIRLWDLNSNVCQGLLRRKGRSCVSYDPQGLIFAVAASGGFLKLFDLRSYDRGPFSSFMLNTPADWSGIKFSNDGKHILLSTLSNTILLVDSFTGDIKQKYTSFVNRNGTPLEASFSPDAQFVLSGSEDSTIHVWNTMTGEEVKVWKHNQSTTEQSPVGVVQWNPKSMMIASGDSSLQFWIPSEE